jgi:DtxR family Mn-dependent transcriptional regulator
MQLIPYCEHMSEAEGRYLAAIRRLTAGGDPATVSALSRDLGLSKASVSEMLDRMATEGLVERSARGAATLTGAGSGAADALATRRVVVERFLDEVLGVAPDHLPAETERLARVVSERLEERMRAALNAPVPPSAPSS